MRHYVASQRNGYSAVDEYRRETVGGTERAVCVRTIEAGLTRKVAERMADALQDAYHQGRVDEHALKVTGEER